MAFPVRPSTAAAALPSLLSESERSLDVAPKSETRELSEIEKSIEKARVMRYSQDRWNEMRQRLESGEALIPQIEKPLPVAERKVLPAPPPLGPGLNVVLPYESGLSISGRKVIDFKLETTLYEQPDLGKGRVNKTDFTLDQQLQVRVKGTVGRKVTVNVDFDDTREDKRDISVVYKGDPDEVLQEAAFGDISISLPSTEFVGYSKSVFGARAELLFRPRTGLARLLPSQLWHRYTPKNWRTFLIGSRTKGITQTKRFTGQTTAQRRNIDDIRYARRKFYLLAFSTGTNGIEHRPIVPESEKIFIDDQDPNNFNINDTTRTFALPTNDPVLRIDGITPSTAAFIFVDNSTNTGAFRQMIRGVDYTVDYVRGVVQFKRQINLRDVIVADYIPKGSATPLSQTNTFSLDPRDPNTQNTLDQQLSGFKPILLKPDESTFFASRELKNYYDLGATRIVRDDGRGNFILRILDLNNLEPSVIVSSTGANPKPVPRYPTDIDVDFENGFVSFISSDLFKSANQRPFPDDIYNFRDVVPDFLKRYQMFVEFKFRRGNFSLDQTNIVSLSEQVFVDGRKMTRDVDYFIDYDVGIVTFFRPEFIRDDSIVEITYDYSPFGGQGEETVVGMRNEIYGTDNFFVGSSLLYNFQPRARGVPDLRSVTRSILVLEADVNWKNIKLGNYAWTKDFDFFNIPGLRNLNLSRFPLEITNLSAEFARSIKNPNTADKALIESFEGIKLEDNAVLNRDAWQIAANPGTGNPGNGGGAYGRPFAESIVLGNEDVRITDINPFAPTESSERVQVLNVDYNLNHSAQPFEAVSVAQTLSRAGLDFYTNRKQFLEVWVFGNNSNANLQFRLGNISENSDGSSVVKTEDTNRNGSLSTGEDIGWSFVNPNGSTTTVGAGNGRIDANDFDVNGRVDDDTTNGNYLSESSITVNFTGWRIFQLPLDIPTTAQAEWSAIKNVRMTVINPFPTALQGSLKIGRVSVVGTRFQPLVVDPSTGVVSAKAFAENNQDSSSYAQFLNITGDPNYTDLYELQEGESKRKEQALAIEYQRNQAFGTPNVIIATATTKEVFTRTLDLSDHKNFRFFLNGDGSDNEFFLRLGSPDNYLEYRTSMVSFPSGWKLVELDILDKNRDGILDNLTSAGNQLIHNDIRPYNARWTIIGSPNLKNISEMVVGVSVRGGSASPASKIHINEVHVSGAVKQEGDAKRANTDMAWPGWGTAGARWRMVDGNFQTLTTQNSGQDLESFNSFMSINRFKFLPTNFTYNIQETKTKKIQQVVDPNVLISVLDEDKSITQSKSVNGNLLMTQLPYIPGSIRSKLMNFDGSYDFNLTERTNDRRDEINNYRLSTSYGLPWQPDILPTRFMMFKPLPTSISASWSKSDSKLLLINSNTDTESTKDQVSVRSSFQPFSRLTFGLDHSRSQEHERIVKVNEARPVASDIINNLGNKYYKQRNNKLSTSGSLRVFSWLTPSFSYNIDANETNNVNDVVFNTNVGSTTFTRGQLKTVNRNSSGDISTSFSPKDVFQYVRYLRSVNTMINSLTFSGGYTVADADTYENVDQTYESFDLLTLNKLYIRGNTLDIPSNAITNARRTNLTATDTSRVSGRWNPFEGFTFLKHRAWKPLLNISGSGSFTETLTRKDQTGTINNSYSRVWPDMTFNTSELEYPLYLRRWMTDTSLRGTYQESLTENLGQTRNKSLSMANDFTFTLFKLLQFSVNYKNSTAQTEDLLTDKVTSRTRSNGFGGQVITTLKWGNWRFTPRYDQDQSQTEDGTGKLTSDFVNRNISLQIFGDVNIPRFFQLPFGKQLNLANRLILTSNLRYGMVRDSVDETRSVDNIATDLTGDFEVTPNIRIAFGGGFTRSMRKIKKEEDFTTFNFTSRVTIQF